MMKKLVFAICMLMTVGAYAQQESKAEELYNQFVDLAKTRKFESAAKTLKKAAGMKIKPAMKAEYYSSLACFYRDSLQDLTAAQEAAIKAHDMEPKLLDAKGLDVSEYSSELMAHIILSDVNEKQKRYDLMESICKCGLGYFDLTIKPLLNNGADDEEYLLCQAMLVFNMAKAQGYQSKFEESDANYQRAQELLDVLITHDPCMYNYKLMFRIAQVGEYNRQKMTQKAYDAAVPIATDFEAAMKVNNEDLRAILEMQGVFYILCVAEMSYNAGYYEESLRVCDEGMTWPESMYHAPLLDIRGKALLKLDREEEARKCWQMVKDRLPDFYKDSTDEDPLRQKFGI